MGRSMMTMMAGGSFPGLPEESLAFRAETSLLVPFTAATPVDYSTNARIPTLVSSAAVNSGVTLFGNATLSLPDTLSRVTFPDDNLYYGFNEDLTWDGWFYWPGPFNAGYHMLMGVYRSATNKRSLGLYINNSGADVVVFRDEGGVSGAAIINQTLSTPLSTGQWYHFRLVRDISGGDVWRLFIDGVVVATAVWAGTLNDPLGGEPWGFGSQGGAQTHGGVLRIGQVRLLKGLCLNTNNDSFAPPTGPWLTS